MERETRSEPLILGPKTMLAFDEEDTIFIIGRRPRSILTFDKPDRKKEKRREPY